MGATLRAVPRRRAVARTVVRECGVRGPGITRNVCIPPALSDAVAAPLDSAKVVFRLRWTPPPENPARACTTACFKAEQGLLRLRASVEDVHVLTREEIVRFGIDRATSTHVGRSVVHKTVIRKNDGDKSISDGNGG